MHAIETIQVVLGEGEPGLLRMILEAQGFEVVGHARDDDELLTVLDVTRPSVLVLDAGISVLAAMAARERAHGAPIVVVWPRDAFTPLAEERVDPTGVILELGGAVRRAVERHAIDEPILIPDVEPPVPAATSSAAVPTAPVTTTRRRPGKRHAFAVAAAWALSLTALGAIGFAVPSAFDLFGDAGHPSIVERPERARTPEREGGAAISPDDRSDGGCGRARAHPNGRRASDPCGRAVGLDRHGPPPGKGRPDDPGRGNAKGKGGAKEHPVKHDADEPHDADGGSSRGRGRDADRGGADGNDKVAKGNAHD